LFEPSNDERRKRGLLKKPLAGKNERKLQKLKKGLPKPLPNPRLVGRKERGVLKGG